MQLTEGFMTDSKLPLALFIMRVTIAAFFAIWAIEKFVKPDTTGRIWAKFYLIEGLPHAGSYAIGVLQLLLVIALLLGIWKFWSTGALMLMHGVSTLSTWALLIDPYSGSNHLFWAAVPTLGALIALFLLRDEDTLYTLGNSRDG
jgi:hypothetical protein